MGALRNIKYMGKMVGAILRNPTRARATYVNYRDAEKNLQKWAEKQIQRIKVQVADYREALDFAEDDENPDRYKLMELYQEIELDDQVMAKRKAVQLGITGTEYYFFDTEKGEELPKLKNDIFDKRWFLDTLNHVTDAEFYGHSLIQFGDWDTKKGYDHKDMELVPRHLVCPEKGFVRETSSEDSGIPFRGKSAFARGLVEIGNKYDKGLFVSVAIPFIMKKNALSFWQDFQQHFGEPILQIATDLLNSKNLDTYFDFIENRGGAGGLVTDIEDKMTVLEAEKTDAYKVYWQMALMSNDAISKVMEGQTMTTDSEGGKYDGNVHADTSLLFRLGRLKSSKFYINDELLPKMINDGFDIGEHVQYRYREFKNVDEIVNRIVKLCNYYHMDKDKIYEMTGIEVGEEREEVGDARAGNSKTAPDPDDK